MKYRIIYFFILPLLLQCNSSESNGNSEDDVDDKTSQESEVIADTTYEKTDSIDPKPTMTAIVDTYTMDEISNSSRFNDVFELYNQDVDITEKWTQKMWGRCCSEADMRFSETLDFKIDVSHEGRAYPLKNALDQDYETTFVFEEKDNVVFSVGLDKDQGLFYDDSKLVSDKIDPADTIMSSFQVTIINGFVKSRQLYYANARVKEVELWLNGEHQCNCTLLDSPEAQVIKGCFPLFMNDKVELRPVQFYPGTKYDDICISEIQVNLGEIAHPEIDKTYSVGE